MSHEAITLTEAIHAASAKLERAVHAGAGSRKASRSAALATES